MPPHIKDDDAAALASQLARLRGLSKQAVMRLAVQAGRDGQHGTSCCTTASCTTASPLSAPCDGALGEAWRRSKLVQIQESPPGFSVAMMA